LYDIKDDDIAAEGVNAFSHPGSEVTPMYHVTTLSNFIKGYDKYSRNYSKSNIPESTFADRFFLLHAHQLPIGVEKAYKLLMKLNIEGDKLLILHTNIKTPHDPTTGFADHKETEENFLVPHPKGQYVQRNWITISDLSILSTESTSTLTGISVEEAASLSLHLQQKLQSYQKVAPRSVSIMPIAKGCQAKCPFCFSKGSVSNDMKQQRMYEDKIEAVLQAAYNRGAERAVITGGGEPFMLPFPRLLKLISQCSSKFSTVCAISNGYYLSQLEDSARLDALKSLDKAGLTVLSLSRHAVTEDENEKVMWLRTESHKVAESWRQAMDRNDLKSLTRLRWVCVLQKGGIDSTEKMHEYVSFVINSGASEICFKELYVSTTVESVYHDNQSNVWSAAHQVPLSLVLEFCEINGFVRIGELPWGAPIYEGVYGNSGRAIKIAAYTEPSVFWERTQGLCRSWNYMANGDVLASLEDKDSQVDIQAYL
jgi:organic radical activating enzyme